MKLLKWNKTQPLPPPKKKSFKSTSWLKINFQFLYHTEMLTLGEAWVFTFKWWNVGKEEKGILTPDSCSISSVWIRTYELGFRRDAVGKMKFLMLRGVLISLSFSSCGFFFFFFFCFSVCIKVGYKLLPFKCATALCPNKECTYLN